LGGNGRAAAGLSGGRQSKHSGGNEHNGAHGVSLMLACDVTVDIT
jgi:hypothetical protein